MASTAGKIIHFLPSKELNFPDACQPQIIYLNLAQRQSQKCGVESSHGAFCGGFKLCLLFSVEITIDPPRVTRCVFHYSCITSFDVATNIHLAVFLAKSVQVPSNFIWLLRWKMSRKRQAPGDSIGMSVWVMFGRFFPQVELCR